MRRLLAGTTVTGTLAAAYAAAGDLDVYRGRLVVILLLWWAGFVIVTRWATSGPGRPLTRPVLTVFALALVVQLPGLAAPPRSSSDAYRYAWDGRVQLSGVSPYRYVPLDDRLAALRDPVIFPGLGRGERSGVVTEPLPTNRSRLLAETRNDPRTRINRPEVPTIYPPIAEAWFAAVAAVTPWRFGTLGLQIGSALLAAAIAALLAALLGRRGRSPTDALWWAWCPTVVAEASNGAHVDVLAVALVLGAVAVAWGALSRSRAGAVVPWATAGVLIGLAASVKLTPLVLLPAFMPWHRLRWRVLLAPLAAIGTLALTYLPHVLAAGSLVLGYLPGYLREESGPNRASSLALVLPRDLAAVLAVIVVLAVAVAVILRRRPDPAEGALWLFGAFLLALTPTYGWYALPLVALAVLVGELGWLVVAAAAAFAYAAASVRPVPAIVYAVAAVTLAVLLNRRRGTARTATRDAAYETTPAHG
jgi:hypothetical protein